MTDAEVIRPLSDLPEAIQAKIEPEPMSGCWLWLGTPRQGYGRFGKHGQVAHRLVYELLVGPIPDGLELDHLCRNRICVSPWHLEPVTRKVNLQRGVDVGIYNRFKTHCPHGHPYSGDNLYVDPAGRRNCRICSRARTPQRVESNRRRRSS